MKISMVLEAFCESQLGLLEAQESAVPMRLSTLSTFQNDKSPFLRLSNSVDNSHVQVGDEAIMPFLYDML